MKACIKVVLIMLGIILLSTDTTIAQSNGHDYGAIVKCSLRDKNGALWFGTTWAGLFKYDGTKFTHIAAKDGLAEKMINSIYEDKDGNIWLGISNGVICYDGKTFTPIMFPAVDVPGQIAPMKPNCSVEGIIQDRDGLMWFGTFGTNHGVYRYDGKAFTYLLPGEQTQGLALDNNGNLWVGQYRYDGKAFTNIFKQQGIIANAVFRTMKDDDGNIWFAMRGSGLYRYDGKTMESMTSNNMMLNDPNAVGKTMCMLFQGSKGIIWIGSDKTNGMPTGKLHQYDGKTFTVVPQIAELSISSLWTAVKDTQGNIWFGGRDGKLCRYDGNNFVDESGKLVVK